MVDYQLQNNKLALLSNQRATYFTDSFADTDKFSKELKKVRHFVVLLCVTVI